MTVAQQKSSSEFALELVDVRKSFGKTEIIRGANLKVKPGERVAIIGPNGAGKSTLFNLISGRFGISSGEIRLGGARIDGLQPYEINRRGLARSFQVSNLFSRLSVFENIRCALLWSHGLPLRLLEVPGRPARRQRPRRGGAGMIKLDKRRDVLAMNLTYAEQRALEIGITIAGGASVILLDEPTAGMSRSETARFVNLIREVTVGKTLLTVEHDMGVVFGLADKIAVLVYGEVIAFDTPEAVRAEPARAGGLPGLGAGGPAGGPGGGPLTMFKLERRPRLLRQEPCAARRALRRAAGRDRRPAGAQRLGPQHHRQDHHGPGGGHGLASAGRTSEILGKQGLRDRPRRHRLRAGEPRHLSHADRAPEPDAGPEGRPGAKQPRWSFDDMYKMFPRLKERQHTEAGVLSGGEQQMLTLCRTLMGDPELIMIDEPTEGLAPKIVELVAEYLRELKRRGIAVLLVEQKLTIALEVADRCLVMGHGQIVFEGTPAELRANSYIRKEWLEV
jgi:branched-chain amino acid transport system ATP-binding protein